jgi:hypothetical protein
MVEIEGAMYLFHRADGSLVCANWRLSTPIGIEDVVEIGCKSGWKLDVNPVAESIMNVI